ncbi:MAG TPA: TetR/AcrR family transcriptional regulator [Thermoleophilaceae bacterium]
MAEAARRPGRPPSGARERVLEAALDVLKSDGYAGLTTAKVAARSGQNKALIAYHFGSKQGLVGAAAREVAESITAEVLDGLERTDSVEEIVRGGLDGLWRVLERDERLPRVYFDLAAASVAEPEARATMREMRTLWRTTLEQLLAGAGMSARDAEAASVATIAALDGLALEWLDRGETPALERARERIVRGICG